jgi:hypothetical protein
MLRDLRCTGVSSTRARLDVARAGPGATALPVRRRPVCRRAAPRSRHWRPLRLLGGGARCRARVVRGDGSRRREDHLDPDQGRLFGHAAPSRHRRGSTWRCGRGGRFRRYDRAQRRGRVGDSVRSSRDSAQRRAGRLRRSVAVPAGPRDGRRPAWRDRGTAIARGGIFRTRGAARGDGDGRPARRDPR